MEKRRNMFLKRVRAIPLVKIWVIVLLSKSTIMFAEKVDKSKHNKDPFIIIDHTLDKCPLMIAKIKLSENLLIEGEKIIKSSDFAESIEFMLKIIDPVNDCFKLFHAQYNHIKDIIEDLAHIICVSEEAKFLKDSLSTKNYILDFFKQPIDDMTLYVKHYVTTPAELKSFCAQLSVLYLYIKKHLTTETLDHFHKSIENFKKQCSLK